MTSINDYMNTEKVEQTQTTQEIVTQQSRSYRLSAKDMEIRDEFVKLKKKTGLTGRIYNWLKNITGTGLGTKKLEQDITKYENGEISKEQITQEIQDYKASQRNARQTTGDTITAATSLLLYSIANKFIKQERAFLEACPDKNSRTVTIGGATISQLNLKDKQYVEAEKLTDEAWEIYKEAHHSNNKEKIIEIVENNLKEAKDAENAIINGNKDNILKIAEQYINEAEGLNVRKGFEYYKDAILEEAEAAKKDAMEGNYEKIKKIAEERLKNAETAKADALKGNYEMIQTITSRKLSGAQKAFQKEAQRLRGKGTEIFKNILKSKGKTFAVLAPVLGLLGMFVNRTFLRIDRIGTKEYKADQTDDMMEDKIKQKELNRYKRREGWGTRLRGFFLGAAAPLTLLGGGIAGIPLYLASALGLKYVTNQEEKNKSFDNFTKSIVDNGAMNAIGTGLMAIPSIKHARFNNGLEDNLEKVVDKIKKSGIASKSLDLKTGYDKIEELLLTKDDNIIKLIEKAKDAKNLEDVQKIITELTDENIFAVKFIQIMGKDGKTIGDVKIPGDLIQALKKSCPPTRNLEEAQNEINRVYGGAYTVERLCGVGTVAETYAAKDKDGNKVAIKMLKVGINEAKITADKNKFIELIKQNVKDPDKQEYFIKNVEDLYQGIVKEVDLKNELEAANEIAKYTTKADVVKPIACKDNIYVMEYAKGISLKDFSELFRYKTDLEDFEREVRKLEDKLNDLNSQNASADEIEEAENKLLYRKNALTLHKLKMEDEHFKKDYEMFNNLNLTKKDLFYLMKQHNAAITEQFEAHGKDGKCLHADPHDANIMINLDAVKSHKGHAIIFIDTGNTITLNKDQQYAASKLKSVVENANTHALAEIALDGVKLPSNMTKEQAIDKYEAKLKEYLFDPEINLFGEKTGNINEIWGDSNFDTEKFIALTDKILGDMGLVPANTQLNLFKSKKSADTSSKQLRETLLNTRSSQFREALDNDNTMQATGVLTAAGLDVGRVWLNKRFGEFFTHLWNKICAPAETIKNNRAVASTANKHNSEEFLMLKMKEKYAASMNSISNN